MGNVTAFVKHERSINLVCLMCYTLICFYNFRKYLRQNGTDPTFLANYRDRIFPFLIECFVMKECSIATFPRPMLKIYDVDGNILKTVSFLDLSVNVKML